MAEKSLAKVQKLFVKIGKVTYPVDSLADASKKYVKAFDASHGFAGEDENLPKEIWEPPVIDQDGKVIGYIAPNGKIFESLWDDKPGPVKIIYDPSDTPEERKKRGEFEQWFQQEFKRPYHSSISRKTVKHKTIKRSSKRKNISIGLSR